MAQPRHRFDDSSLEVDGRTAKEHDAERDARAAAQRERAERDPALFSKDTAWKAPDTPQPPRDAA